MTNRAVKPFQSILATSSKAQDVWHRLNGVFVVCKPPDEHVLQLEQTLRYNVCRDLNKLEQRPPSQHVWIEGATNTAMTVATGPSLADHPLLTGPRYQWKDLRFQRSHNMYTQMSGVLLMGINAGCVTAHAIREGNPTKFYKLKGILGKATENYYRTGKVLEKTTWEHVKRDHLDKICAAMQSSHQKKMFEVCGVPIQSQTAYELAVQGPIRPSNNKIPMVYSIKCINFEPPEFTLEIVCLNEDEMFLKGLVHDIGMQVRSTAYCSQIQCTRFGLFTLEHALLKKHWTLHHIANNMAKCRNILAENKFLEAQTRPILKEYSIVKELEEQEQQQLITA